MAFACNSLCLSLEKKNTPSTMLFPFSDVMTTRAAIKRAANKRVNFISNIAQVACAVFIALEIQRRSALSSTMLSWRESDRSFYFIAQFLLLCTTCASHSDASAAAAEFLFETCFIINGATNDELMRMSRIFVKFLPFL
jgi:hypothetical protein